ncbi:MAG: D-alanyl-D-alanine carboxypeptidase [Rhizobiales bacterium]|nr:D-alanyl-D-alanine carboxypeptidase [Hyphomicrobiales bacterium]
MRLVGVESGTGHLAMRLVLTVLAALIFVLATAVPQAEAARKKRKKFAPYNPPYASIVVDINSGRTLQATHADALRHPASITKVMTLYMLFEQIERGRFKLNSELPVSRFAASQKPSKLGLPAGSTIAVEDAIKALVTKSANDVAVVVAEAIGGSEERFGQMMTAKARSIGMSRSVFRNASGLPNPAQVTTARDLVTLGRAVHDRFPRFYHYFNTRSFEFDGYAYRNHNKLLGRVEGVDGIKTGFTRASGFNLLTSARADGRHLITVVLGGRSGRARDAQVAALVEEHLPRAVAGRRTTRSVEVAAAQIDEDDDEKPAQRVVAATPAPQAAPAAPAAPVAAAAPSAEPKVTALPTPPIRVRTAVIAESPADQGLTRSRSFAIASSGPSSTVASATTPLALVGTTPRSQALRAINSGVDSLPPQRDQRFVPPGNVRYTNALPSTTPQAESNQPLPKTAEPTLPAKAEDRLPAPRTAAPAPASAPIPAPLAVAAAPASQSKAVAAATPTQRSGWIIQLAAAESEAKAKVVLDNARGKTARLKSAEAFTEPVTKGGSTLYRARFAGFDADGAQEACKALKRSGFNCFAQRI